VRVRVRVRVSVRERESERYQEGGRERERERQGDKCMVRRETLPVNPASSLPPEIWSGNSVGNFDVVGNSDLEGLHMTGK